MQQSDRGQAETRERQLAGRGRQGAGFEAVGLNPKLKLLEQVQWGFSRSGTSPLTCVRLFICRGLCEMAEMGGNWLWLNDSRGT